MTSQGYPGKYRHGFPISGIEAAEQAGAIVFQAGTRMQDGRLVTAGGRVLGVTALGQNMQAAVANAYRGVEKISFEGATYRHDIAHRALDRQRRA